jgi:hypothetical protein
MAGCLTFPIKNKGQVCFSRLRTPQNKEERKDLGFYFLKLEGDRVDYGCFCGRKA